MNILDAKNEIKSAIRIYLEKDENGKYVIPDERQRPVFLIGAPGIGKTAIMSKIAEELDIGYIGYTITHHTRQSAIGLPFISQKVYGGKTYSVTEYTMSEIVASVYEAIETQGKKEGILFIDEINCVSETLAPAMLELLQRKKFGPHKIPEGWILTCAGNPEEYNKSVNELDMVTLDRVKKLVVEPDYDAFKLYAQSVNIHGAVIAFLSLNNDYLFKAERGIDGYEFVTPRGWEDLSTAIKEYEKLDIPVTEQFVSQYIQYPQVSAEFIRFYKIFIKFFEMQSSESVENGELERVNLEGENFESRFAVAEILRSKVAKIAEKASSKIEALAMVKRVIKEGEKDEKILVKETETLMRNLSSNKWNRYKKTAYKPIIEVLNSQNVNEGIEKLEEEYFEYAKTSLEKIRRIIAFAKNSLGNSQEFSSFVSGVVGNEFFINLISEFDWSEIYALICDVLDGDSNSLKAKAKKVIL